MSEVLTRRTTIKTSGLTTSRTRSLRTITLASRGRWRVSTICRLPGRCPPPTTSVHARIRVTGMGERSGVCCAVNKLCSNLQLIESKFVKCNERITKCSFKTMFTCLDLTIRHDKKDVKGRKYISTFFHLPTSVKSFPPHRLMIRIKIYVFPILELIIRIESPA